MSEHKTNSQIDEKAPLNQTIHQRGISNERSPWVTREGEIEGILPTVDVAEKVGRPMKAFMLEWG